MNRTTTITIALLILCSIITACAANTVSNGAPDQHRNNSGRFNVTDEQRQQMMQQQTAACQGKSINDSCTMESQRGERNGTCVQRNETLRCSFTRQ